MTVYWLLLAFPAMMAVLFPEPKGRHGVSLAQASALAAFVAVYTLISLLRYKIGADWYAYDAMYSQAGNASLLEGMAITDPLFALLLWISAQLGTDLYPVNAFCSLLLVIGVVRVALTTREPWLAIAGAVPYLLIVVGLGYVRQAGAIGLILIAISSLERGKRIRTIVYLAIAAGFHSSAVSVFPFVGLALANRNKLQIFLLATVGSIGFFFLLQRQFAYFETTYLESDFESSGALVRIAMSVVASLLLLVRWRSFAFPAHTRLVWLGFAASNIAAFVILGTIQSSTAVDRLALYFAVVQVFVFGNIRELVGFARGFAPIMRLLVIALAVAVQLVWLVLATHAEYWVPYRSVLT